MKVLRHTLVPLVAKLSIIFAISLTLWIQVDSPSLEAQETQSYVVQKGDTLASISRKFYGKSSLGTKLWRANKGLVAHPNRLTAGDTIYIFPESTLNLNKPVEVPPRPEGSPVQLFKKGQLLQTAFPEFFSFVADPRGLGNTGITRVHVKRLVTYKRQDPETNEIIDEELTKFVDQIYEVHEIGEIIASSDRGFPVDQDYYYMSRIGRLLLSTGDIVIVRFTQDLSSLMDSDSYDDYDPYFNSFPVYGMEDIIQGPNKDRPDYAASLGQLFKFRGKLNIVSRVEGLAPSTSQTSNRAKRSTKNNQDISPVSYVAKITYAEDAMYISDKIFAFIPTDPGPERVLEAPYVEEPDTYVSPGR